MLLIPFLCLATFTAAQAEDFRPDVPDFYTSLVEVEAAMEGRCTIMETRELDLLLDVAREHQQQIDCQGFDYRGRPRVMELMFSDGELYLVIVLIEEEEYADLAAQFRETYGMISHESDIGLFFYWSAVAIRTVPHEVVFTSKRTRANYHMYMESMADQAAVE